MARFEMDSPSKEQILEVIGRFFDHGASIEEILLGLDPPMSRRTLQRRLLELTQEGRVEAVGQARARRYILIKGTPPPSKPAGIPLSLEGAELRSKIIQPLHLRKPVGYHREFLESYRPNQTFYLPHSLREKLAHLGGANTRETILAGTFMKQIFHRLLIDLSWNSSRLEGNTYSLLETERLFDAGVLAKGKNLQETQMLLNHKAAIEFLITSAEGLGVTRYTILNLHTLLSDNLLPDPSACGRMRLYPVGIEKSTYLPSAIPQLIEECFNRLIDLCNAIEDPFEQAFFLMVQLPYLQPFDDVNKRTSRLAANIPLIRNHLSPLSFIDIPQEDYIDGLLSIYEFNRTELLRDVFEWAYERSSALYSITRQSLGEPDPIRLYYREQIRETVRMIVLGLMGKEQAVQTIRTDAKKHIPKKDQEKWIELLERELLGLHEGNLSRYQLLPKDFTEWQSHWKNS